MPARALRRLADPDAAKNFEHNFKSLERLWEAVAPDPVLYDHRFNYNWLCGIYIAHRRRLRGPQSTYGELAAKTRQLIEENTTFLEIADTLPVYKIDKDTVGVTSLAVEGGECWSAYAKRRVTFRRSS